MIIQYFITVVSIVVGCFTFYVNWIFGMIIILLALIYFQLAKFNDTIQNRNEQLSKK